MRLIIKYLSLYFYIYRFFFSFGSYFFPKKNFILNVKKHISWLNVTEWASHFRAYDKDDQIKIFKHVIPKNFRGGGLLWIHKILLLYIPIIYLIFSILVVFLMSLFFIIKILIIC